MEGVLVYEWQGKEGIIIIGIICLRTHSWNIIAFPLHAYSVKRDINTWKKILCRILNRLWIFINSGPFHPLQLSSKPHTEVFRSFSDNFRRDEDFSNNGIPVDSIQTFLESLKNAPSKKTILLLEKSENKNLIPIKQRNVFVFLFRQLYWLWLHV